MLTRNLVALLLMASVVLTSFASLPVLAQDGGASAGQKGMSGATSGSDFAGKSGAKSQARERTADNKSDNGDDYDFSKKHPILGVILLIVLVVAAGFWIVGHIMLLIAAFRTGILWGLGYLFVPVVGLIYMCLHWNAAKKAVCIMLIGVAVAVLGIAPMTLVEYFVDHR